MQGGLETPAPREAPTSDNPTTTLLNGAGSDREFDAYSQAPASALISPAEWLSGKSPSREGKKVTAPVTPAIRNVQQSENYESMTPGVESPLSLNPVSVDGHENSLHVDKKGTATLGTPETPASSTSRSSNAVDRNAISPTLIELQDDAQYQTPPTGNHVATFDSKTLTLSSPASTHAFLAKEKMATLQQDTPSPTEVRYLGMPGVRKWLSGDKTTVTSPTHVEGQATLDREKQGIPVEETVDVASAGEKYPVPGEWIESNDPSRGRSGSSRKLKTEPMGRKTSGVNHKYEKKQRPLGLDKAIRLGRSHGSPSLYPTPPNRRKKGEKFGKSKGSRSCTTLEDHEELEMGFSPDYRPDKSFERVEEDGQQQVYVHLPKTLVKIPSDVPINWNPSSGVPLANTWPEKEELMKMTPEQEEIQKEARRQDKELERLEREHLEHKKREEEEKLWQAIAMKAAAIRTQQDREHEAAMDAHPQTTEDERITRLKRLGLYPNLKYWEQEKREKALAEKKRQEEEAEAEKEKRIAELNDKRDGVHKKRVAARAQALAKRVMQEGLKMKLLCLERDAEPALAMECADAYMEHIMTNVFVNLMEGGDLARFDD